MRLCIGTSKGILMLDAERGGAPLMVLADPSSIWCMAQDCKDPNLLYAGSSQHAYMGSSRGAGSLSRSQDGGRTWNDITPRGAREEDVWALAASPDRGGEVYIGTSHARLFHSDNGGRSFEECKGFLELPGRDRWSFAPPPHVPHVRSITFDPKNPATMYIGVEEGGVAVSRDRGRTFELLNNGIYPDVHAVAVDPGDSRRLYASTGRGFYRSENGGASWVRLSDGISRPYTVALAAHPQQSGVIYLSGAAGPPPSWFVGANGADAMMFRSLNHGDTFTATSSDEHPMRGTIMGIMPSPNDPDELFAVSSDGTIFRSRDRGESMVTISSKLPPSYAMVALA